MKPHHLISRILPLVFLTGLPLAADAAPQSCGKSNMKTLLERQFDYDPVTEPKITPEEMELLRSVEPLLQDKLPKAIRTLEKNFPKAPSPALLFYLGGFRMNAGSYEEAAQSFEAALVKMPAFRRAWRSLAAVRLEQGRHREALTALGKALEFGAGDVKVYAMLGYCHLQMGNNRAALTAYEQAYLLEPDNAQWLRGAMQCQFAMGNYRDALSLLEQVEQTESESGELLRLKAQTLQHLGKSTEAMTALTRAGLLQPLKAEDSLLLGDLYLETGAFDEAARHYKDWLGKTESADSATELMKRIRVLTRHKHWQSAQELVDLARSRTKLSGENDALLSRESARIKLAGGADLTAAAEIEKLLSEDPSQTDLALLLAEHYEQTGETEKAERYFTRAATGKAERYRATIGRARLEMTLKRYNEALRDLEAASLLRPDTQKLEPYVRALREYIRSQAKE